MKVISNQRDSRQLGQITILDGQKQYDILSKMIQLYLPEKYDVVIGNPKSSTALCTCWTDPKILIKTNTELTEKCAIIGTLYSKEGINIILRNLALNPHIRKIYIWSQSPLSNTPFGKAGRETLLEFWKNSQAFNPHKEISPETIEQIKQYVELVEISSLDEIKFEELATYMSACEFPETKPDKGVPFPSELVGWQARGNTVADTWLKVVDRIVRYGIPREKVEGQPYKELQVIQWTIENENPSQPYIPDWPEKILQSCGLQIEAINEYKKSLLNPNLPDGISYTYGQRLLDYPGNVNQIEILIENLKKDPAHRNAVATTLFPPVDFQAKQRPCLALVQFLNTEHGDLNMFATFRAHEIFRAANANAFGLLALHEYVCQKTNLKRGRLTITSNCAYIYLSDLKEAEDLLKCKKWESVNTRFDENIETDPRGVIRIRLQNEKIITELVSLMDGSVLVTLEGTNAKEIIMKIAKLELLVFPSHYADITFELVKAEIALKLKKDYTQDKPLILNDFSLI